MIDVSEVVIDPDLAQPFTVTRSTGQFNTGVWKTQQQQLKYFGVISVATDRDIAMLPEGDVITEAKVFHTDQPIFTTQEVPAAPGVATGYSSDILTVTATGEIYRVLQVKQIPQSGYWRAIAMRLSPGA